MIEPTPCHSILFYRPTSIYSTFHLTDMYSNAVKVSDSAKNLRNAKLHMTPHPTSSSYSTPILVIPDEQEPNVEILVFSLIGWKQIQ